MKKNLIALAVLAASGVASAQSTVTLYGIADVWFGSTKNEGLANPSRQTMVGSGGVDESRFGLKGSEDLGGGLKANFVLEQGFNIDNGSQATAGQAFSRQAYVGFSGGFGEAKIGKVATAYDDISGATRPAFNSALSPDSNVWVSHSAYNWNPSNSLYYATPSMSGFSGAVSYSLGENKTSSTNAGQVISANVKYEKGPVYAGLAYQTEKADGAAPTAKFSRLNASYDLGVVKLLVGLGHANQVYRVNYTNRTNEYEIGADFPVSSVLTLSGGYAQSKSSYLGVGVADTKRTGFGVAASYLLSKRTFLYGGVQAAKQTQSGAADVKSDLYGIGIHHTF